MTDEVGRVLGSQHTSTREFRVVIGEERYLQLDDLVVVTTDVPGKDAVSTYGVVTEVEAVYEGASFESDTFRIAEEGSMPGAAVRSAQVSVTRVDPELWVAPDPGGLVHRATGEARDKALYTDEMRCTPMRWADRCRWGWAAMVFRSMSTSTSSMVAKAATCRFLASAE